MTPDRSSNRLAAVYLVISVGGLLAVCFCIARMALNDDPNAGPSFLDALFGNWTSTIVVVDLLIAVAASIVWVLTEARRLGMRWVLWLVLISTTPYAFSLPLFLAMRERRRDVLLRNGTTAA